MSSKTSYLCNKLTDWFWRGVAYTPPATHYFGLLTSTHGPRANSTAYALNNTISVVGNDGKTNLYKVTTAGTTAAAQSTLYPGVNNEVITDGTAVLTEQSSALMAGTITEVSGGSYARVGVTANTTNFAATNGATTTTNPSTGTTKSTSNNAAITFPSPTANWGYVWGMGVFDASTAGNMTIVDGLAAAKTVNNGDPAPAIAISAFTFLEDTV